jgi:hypothetical protein
MKNKRLQTEYVLIQAECKERKPCKGYQMGYLGKWIMWEKETGDKAAAAAPHEKSNCNAPVVCSTMMVPKDYMKSS